MKLVELCDRLEELSDDGVIFAERLGGEFAPDSRATVVVLSPDELQTPAASVAARHCPGLSYCLEVLVAREAVAVWSLWRNGRRPTAAERAEAVCYKANNDAWGPPNFPTAVETIERVR